MHWQNRLSEDLISVLIEDLSRYLPGCRRCSGLSIKCNNTRIPAPSISPCESMEEQALIQTLGRDTNASQDQLANGRACRELLMITFGVLGHAILDLSIEYYVLLHTKSKHFSPVSKRVLLKIIMLGSVHTISLFVEIWGVYSLNIWILCMYSKYTVLYTYLSIVYCPLFSIQNNLLEQPSFNFSCKWRLKVP